LAADPVALGGYGPLIASHGAALDSLAGAELVLADGQCLTVDSDNDPDLLWALQGAGDHQRRARDLCDIWRRCRCQEATRTSWGPMRMTRSLMPTAETSRDFRP
jgi:FAD/FMN-containing dehydrogenase